MPNYEVIKARCVLRGKEAVLPATYVSEPGGGGKLIRRINDCLSKDTRCDEAGCKFCSGQKDPFQDLSG